METKFIAWLTTEMDRRGWNNSELGRRAGVTHSNVSNVISGTKNPGLDFCVKIAKALGEPADRVLRQAGLIPPLPFTEDDPTLNEIYEFAKQLTPEERRRLAKIARLYLQEQRERYDPENREGNATSLGSLFPSTT